MHKSFFVTGTDTNVGKTVLSALLCAALPARYWKPIQTGADEGTDRQTVLSCTGMVQERCFPEAYVFADPVSPHLAAQRSGKEIVLEQIKFPQMDSAMPLIVEGAGGVMAPVNRHQLMTDLMRHLSLPVILAARSTLGTINHTLLSLHYLQSSGIRIHGVVLIGPQNSENREAIEHYGRTRVIGEVPLLQKIDRASLCGVFATSFRQEAFL
ncbi:MAG TPA: dethiobiotin synthase [Candidatus Angelobacter sp.]